MGKPHAWIQDLCKREECFPQQVFDMNVNDIAYMYNSSPAGSVAGGVSPAKSVTQTLEAVKENLEKSGNSGFSASLGEEISKLTAGDLTDAEAKRVSEFRELAGALDRSVLGNMVDGATDKELAALSEDLLGSGKGREVFSRLMEGHFENIVLSDKDDEKDSFDKASDTFSDTVTKTQDIIDKLEAAADTINTANNNDTED